MSIGDPIKGQIRVASRIVDYLSSGLYNSPAACLKELVNNSYDADATRVDLFVKPDSERIIIADDGEGMSAEEFERHFERVSESHKRDESDRTDSGRPKVGKIGIGFIAANELCDVMEIISTKEGSDELLTVEINFAEMRQPPEARRRDGSDYVKADYEGEVTRAEPGEHYTHVLLKEIRPTAQGIITGVREARQHTSGSLTIYGKKPDKIRTLVAQAEDWGDLDEYSQAMLKVALNCPVRYLPKWFPPDRADFFRHFDRNVSKLKFEVCCDGTDLRKPVVLDPGEDNLVKPLRIKGPNVAAEGYFYAKRRALRPQWLNGVMIRIRNAGVDEYDSTFMGFKSTEGRLFQSWISCEMWASDSLEEALNIDRRTLRETHPAYVELQEKFHDELSAFITEVRRHLYTAPAAKRRSSEARSEVERLTEVIERPETALRPRVRKELAGRARRSEPRDTAEVRQVLRKYSVADLYELALNVARETLSAQEYERFAQALADRLLS
jgi:hypothetical protein